MLKMWYCCDVSFLWVAASAIIFYLFVFKTGQKQAKNNITQAFDEKKYLNKLKNNYFKNYRYN